MHSFFSGSTAHVTSSGPFYELLGKLTQEHEKEIGELHGRIVVLQNQLCQVGTGALANDFGQSESDSEMTKPERKSKANRGILQRGLTVELHPRDSRETVQFSIAPVSDSQGAEVLELKGVWKELIRHHASRHSGVQQRLTERFRAMTNQIEEEDGKDDDDNHSINIRKIIRHGVISPNSTWRLYWECTGLLLVCFDMINIPLSTVFAPPDSYFSWLMDWTTLLFWSADMLQNFLVGFYERGNLVMKQPYIVKKYLKGWFFMDAIVVIPDWFRAIASTTAKDWFLTIAGSRTQAGDLSRLLRTSRAIRILRLLRVMKLQRVINKLYDMIDNEYSFIIAELIKMMIVILVLNHLIACGWFAIGKLTATHLEMDSWVTWTEKFLQSEIGYQYSTSLHWTLTQFTPASMDVVARNILERCYSIIVLLFAMVAFSSIVGTVTSSMTVIRQMKNDKQKQFWLLRRYLKQKNVSLDLTMRMTRFLEHQLARQQRLIQAGKVTLLQQLSDQLARELAYEMYEPCLKKHAFFRFLSKEMKGVAARICQIALKAMQVATDDTIFSVGEEASKAFVIKSGELGYAHGSGHLLTPPPSEQEWLAEAVIWTQWRYRGKFFAVKPSDLLALDSSRFAEAMSIHPKPVNLARHYGQKFVLLLNSQSPSLWTDILRDEMFYNGAVDEVGRANEDGSWDGSNCSSDDEYPCREYPGREQLNGHNKDQHEDHTEKQEQKDLYDVTSDKLPPALDSGDNEADVPEETPPAKRPVERRVPTTSVVPMPSRAGRGGCFVNVCPCGLEETPAKRGQFAGRSLAFWRCP